MDTICPSTALAPTSCSRRMCSSTSRTCRPSRPSCCASSNPMVSRSISCRRPVGGFGPRRRTTLGWPRNWPAAWRAERVPSRHPVREPPPRSPVHRTRASAASSGTYSTRARHGEIGNTVTELYYFSRHRWTRLFEATGWRIDHYGTNGLAYTGHSLAGGALGLPSRRRISRVLGSACHVFVLRKA